MGVLPQFFVLVFNMNVLIIVITCNAKQAIAATATYNL